MRASLLVVLWLLFLVSSSLDAFSEKQEFELDVPWSEFEGELQSYAVVHGLTNELELLKEAFQRIRDGEIEGFDASVDPERYAHHKPSPECDMNVTQLIAYQGYGYQEHYTVTEDGYVLALQRILPKSGVPNNSSKVVLLQHGLLDSATTWVINQDYNSLGFMLVDAGFDVWLSNSRGNKYSHTHIHLKDTRRKFWEFSWDEIAKYDLPTVVDFVTFNTGVDKIHYVGHSQGTLIGFTGFAQNKDLASKIEHFYALGPILSVGDNEGLIRIIAKFHKPIYRFLKLIGYEEFLPNNQLGKRLCSISPLTCKLLAFFIAGKNFEGFNETRADVYFTHFPAGSSLQNTNHWCQIIESNLTQMYDFGWVENMQHYHQMTAPIYNVSELTVPVSLFYGGSDKLAVMKNVQLIKETIPDIIVYEKYLAKYNHLDFVWGTTAHVQVYNTIIQQIKHGVRN